jgi:hypothetical protein
MNLAQPTSYVGQGEPMSLGVAGCTPAAVTAHGGSVAGGGDSDDEA